MHFLLSDCLIVFVRQEWLSCLSLWIAKDYPLSLLSPTSCSSFLNGLCPASIVIALLLFTGPLSFPLFVYQLLCSVLKEETIFPRVILLSTTCICYNDNLVVIKFVTRGRNDIKKQKVPEFQRKKIGG
jgi:hypothetical protein